MAELLGDERGGIRYSINGLISMTPDGHPVIGQHPEVAGLWSAAASWVKEGPGIGRAPAEQTNGAPPEIHIPAADDSPSVPPHRTSAPPTAPPPQCHTH